MSLAFIVARFVSGWFEETSASSDSCQSLAMALVQADSMQEDSEIRARAQRLENNCQPSPAMLTPDQLSTTDVSS